MLIAHARTLGSERGRPLSLTLHRAFDLAPDLPAALETAIALGFDRILTSGGQPQAADALPMLTTLVERAAGRIVILAGSGVSAATGRMSLRMSLPTVRVRIQPTSCALRMLSPRRWKRQVAKE